MRLRLIEPDAEDEPFAQVPQGAFVIALLVPVALTAFQLGSLLAARSVLPNELAVHWDYRGVADRFAPALTAFALPFSISAASTIWALVSVAACRPPLARGAVIGLATLLSAVGAWVWALAVANGLGYEAPGWAFPVGLLAVLALPLAVLTLLSRSGRAAEIERDRAR